jgi:hypothetical protein
MSATTRGLTLGALLASVALTLPCASQAVTPKPPHPPKPPPAAKPPLATTGSTSDVSYSSAALTGVVDPHGVETSCYFQYGPTTAYGSQTPSENAGSGTVGVKVSRPIGGLQLGATYHYRLVAVSSAGPGDGQDRTFTTKQIPLKFVITKTATADVFGSPFTVAGTLTGTGAAHHQVILQANTFPYLGAFTDLGAPVSTGAEGGFTFRVPSISQTTELRVQTLDALPTYSQVVTEHVAVRVTLHAHATKSPGLVRLEGTVAPSEVGATVVFQRLRPSRGPAGVGSAVIGRGTARVSRFSAVVDIRRSGYYRALVRVTNGRQVGGTSRTILLHGAPRPLRKAHRSKVFQAVRSTRRTVSVRLCREPGDDLRILSAAFSRP